MSKQTDSYRLGAPYNNSHDDAENWENYPEYNGVCKHIAGMREPK
jgi:hypothetical protein